MAKIKKIEKIEKPVSLVENEEDAEEDITITFKNFLESTPANQPKIVHNLYSSKYEKLTLNTPRLSLFCDNSLCGGIREFSNDDPHEQYIKGTPGQKTNIFMNYICANCRAVKKTFSLIVLSTDPKAFSKNVEVIKLGEFPPFGEKTPPRLLRIFGEKHRTLFLKGRRSEFNGLGIGAFSYYRRIVEEHKNELFDAIIKVAEKINAPQDLISNLKQAKNSFQFSNAFKKENLKIPESLLLDGENPLSLLHRALSIGIHELDDEKCLDLASNIRIVLSALAERIDSVLTDHRELTSAVNSLKNLKS